MLPDDIYEVVITAPDRPWLENLCRDLIERRLAASAHVVHPVTSIYRWQGSIEQAVEARAFLRSRADVIDALVAFVVERHPYEIPNVTVLPIHGGNPSYLTWVRHELDDDTVR